MGGFLLDPDSYVLARWLFLRLLGIIYIIAFASFGVQLKGLIGELGILSAKNFIARARETLGRRGFWQYPTLAWLSTRDNFLLGICVVGILLGLLLVLGWGTTWVLLLLWAGYLSLVVASQIFLSYQWDVLLVEAGFLAVFLSPPSLTPAQASAAPPSRIIIFLFVWLLFKLIFMSGLLKWVGGDPTWRGLTALSYHYWTQPLPTPLAWWMQKAPAWFQKFSTAFALFCEIGVPFLFFLPDPLRQIGALFSIGLQILILLTGNFAFFNWLTIFLCVFLFHDAQLAVLEAWLVGLAAPPLTSAPAWGLVIPVLLTLIYIPVGLLFMLARVVDPPRWVQKLYPLVEVLQDWRLVNSYGLFVSMTTTHPEIILEGSDDGQNWQPYRFRFKIDDPRKPLPLVAPHQPRLDWQMWFAALGDYTTAPWFLHFVERLLQGSPPVLGLLAHNPFPDHPPKYLRGVLYEYTFSTFAERRASHARWDRAVMGQYMPPASLQKD